MYEATVQNNQQWSYWSLWFGLLAGPIIYSLHFLTVYWIAEAACQANLLRYRVLGLEAISFWVLLLTVVAAALTGYGALLAYRDWRRMRDNEAQNLPSYPPFMAFVGLWLSASFTVVILLTGLPALFLVLCDWI